MSDTSVLDKKNKRGGGTREKTLKNSASRTHILDQQLSLSVRQVFWQTVLPTIQDEQETHHSPQKNNPNRQAIFCRCKIMKKVKMTQKPDKNGQWRRKTNHSKADTPFSILDLGWGPQKARNLFGTIQLKSPFSTF